MKNTIILNQLPINKYGNIYEINCIRIYKKKNFRFRHN